MEDKLVAILTAENTQYGRDIVFGKTSVLYPEYTIVESMCIHNTFEYTEFVFLLKKNDTSHFARQDE